MSLEALTPIQIASNSDLATIREREEINAENESIFNDSTSENQTSLQEVTDIQEEKPVSFKEGLSLFGKGFVNKLKNIGTAIVKHPIKTLAAIGATTALFGAACSAATLIGITSATAASIITVGFAGFAIGKGLVDGIETRKDYKEGRYNEVRYDCEKLGSDGVDIALTLPFLPKAIKQITRFMKYGTSTIGLNTELIGNIAKNGAKSIPMELAKANTMMNYEIIANEMGLTVKPELEFSYFLFDGALAAGFEPATGKIKINKFYNTIANNLFEKALRHELEHFQQCVDIVKTTGIDGYTETLDQFYNIKGWQYSFNNTFWNEVDAAYSAIEPGSIEANNALIYADGWANYGNTTEQFSATSSSSLFESLKANLKLRKLYKSNAIEIGAVAAQNAFEKAVVRGRPSAFTNSLIAQAFIAED